jgi:hypothetical protein
MIEYKTMGTAYNRTVTVRRLTAAGLHRQRSWRKHQSGAD